MYTGVNSVMTETNGNDVYTESSDVDQLSTGMSVILMLDLVASCD